MTRGNEKMAASATFGCLALFYLGSVFLQVSSLGWAWTLDAAQTERALAYSLALRIIGGLISLIVFALIFASAQWQILRVSLAWILAFGVTIVVVIDNLSPQSGPMASQALVWLIAAGVIGVHFFGAILARQATAQ